MKLAKDVFFVPILTTWGGFMTNFFFSPVTISGFLARIMSNTLLNNYTVAVKRREKWHQCFVVEWSIKRQWYQQEIECMHMPFSMCDENNFFLIKMNLTSFGS